MVKSDEKLERGAEAVNYELGALVDCYRGLLRSEGDFDAIGSNAYLEAMLVHARCLIEFIARPRNKGYIHWHDYLDEWEVADTAASDRASDLFGEISKHLSHLSWHRARGGENPRWPYELPNLVMTLFKEFAVEVRNVHGDKPWTALFEGGVQYIEQQLRPIRPRAASEGATTSGEHMVVMASELGGRPLRSDSRTEPTHRARITYYLGLPFGYAVRSRWGSGVRSIVRRLPGFK